MRLTTASLEGARGNGTLLNVDTVDMEVVSADGTRLAVRRFGHGVPVVMIHGSAGGLDSWSDVARLLAGEFEVWVYARRGYAHSGGVRGQKTFADDVADVAAVAAAVGGRPHLVGGSYGATTVLHAIRGTAARFRSAAVFEPPLGEREGQTCRERCERSRTRRP